MTFSLKQAFANVIGSTNDPKPKPYTSWYGAWKHQFGFQLDKCSSYKFDEFECTEGDNLDGGHVALDKDAQQWPVGSDAVYIIPICRAHNNNNKVYMEPVSNREALWLKNYLKKEEE